MKYAFLEQGYVLLHIIPKCFERNVSKCPFGHVRQAMIQVSLRIRVVWSESSLGTFWIANEVKFLNEDNEGSDQTAAQADLRLR